MDALAEVAAALTDRHIRADGYCSETHYPEAERLLAFLYERGYDVSPIIVTEAGGPVYRWPS